MRSTLEIYCPNHGARHDYIFDLIFDQLLGISYRYVDDCTTCDLNYSHEIQAIGIQCTPFGLLSESGIRNDIEVLFEEWDETHCFFKTSDSNLPFDVFSASFYLVCRYDEYLDFEADDHDRFPARFCSHIDYIKNPLVNIWALKTRDLLKTANGNLAFNERSFEFKSTIDIDQAWKFKHKGIKRNIAGTVRDLFYGKWENFLDRWPTLLGLRKDSFFNFDWQQKLHEENTTNVHYFILLAELGKYDKNINPKNRAFQKLIRLLYSLNKSSVGIHPSYSSNSDETLVSKEIGLLSDCLGDHIRSSRQHFLMHRMPQTYRTLVKNGIKEDHTMGFSTHTGFRAGISAPFYWFDLSTNEATDLRLVPFCVMDITPLHYDSESPEEATQSIQNLMKTVYDVGGLFVSLWHNESLSETERWKNWRKVYQIMIEQASHLDLEQ